MLNKIKKQVNKCRIFSYFVYIPFFIYSMLFALACLIMRIFPIQENKIVCCSMKGRRYGDNPKYIVDEIRRQKLDYEIVWLMRPEYIEDVPEGVIPAKHTFFKIAYELATAKIWIDSNTKQYGTLKRKKQYYIQTWHGSYGLKKFGLEITGKKSVIDIKNTVFNAKIIDLMLSNSRKTTEIYRKSFGYTGEVLECGSPRNDLLYMNTGEIKEKVMKQFKIHGKRLALYAPTFRSDYGTNAYDLDLAKTAESLKERFGGEWVILVRLHPSNIKEAVDFIKYTDTIINATDYSVMQELLVTCDVLISDYSSCMFDFVTTGKPCFMYAADAMQYKEDRDFYFDIYSLPFPLAENNKQMEENILSFNEKQYHEELQALFTQVGLCDNGNACKSVVEWIQQLIQREAGGINEHRSNIRRRCGSTYAHAKGTSQTVFKDL